MLDNDLQQTSQLELESLTGIVERVTFHNPENGWTVLKVSSFKNPSRLIPVLIHQAKVFAGATMKFWGHYHQHPKHGQQFKAIRAVDQKPATTAALEKYLGSGLIQGVGPAIARRIVAHFKDRTLEVFESEMEELMQVPGIADKKLTQIKHSWEAHRAIRDVMLFLQSYGVSTLFATKIFKAYRDQAIKIVSENPYRLAQDIYGIGFFSADRIAIAMGFERAGVPRVEAGIRHVLSSSRELGHCFLTEQQMLQLTPELLREPIPAELLKHVLENLLKTDQIKRRDLRRGLAEPEACYYSKGLYFDELLTAKHILRLLLKEQKTDDERVKTWVKRYCEQQAIQLSTEQQAAIHRIVHYSFSCLTGGPGCGKTTTTRVLVKLLQAMKKKVLLAAPTGRAAQRMTEVIGCEAKTLHRLLEWAPQKGSFMRDADDPLQCDFLIVDETSMLDISLASALLKAISEGTQVLWIGDPDQLPAVGAGNVLADLLRANNIPRFQLTKIFRQAEASEIIRFAHEINVGTVPRILSPLANVGAFQAGHDCLFVDADEATQDQIKFIQRVKQAFAGIQQGIADTYLVRSQEEWLGRLKSHADSVELDPLYRPEVTDEQSVRSPVLVIPEKFKHVNLKHLAQAPQGVEELLQVLKKVHPWSSLRYGMTALETVIRLYTKTLPEWLGTSVEIQVLTPQVRGTLGTFSLNDALQRVHNPEASHKRQIILGERLFRVGDRVIQTRNNYDLGVFNGDIGSITAIDTEEMSVEVKLVGTEDRRILFEKEDLSDLSLAYAITIHKSQGSEFQVVIIPVLGQHYNMLFRNLMYTGLTRAKKLAVFVGTRRAFSMAIRKVDSKNRQTALVDLLTGKIDEGLDWREGEERFKLSRSV